MRGPSERVYSPWRPLRSPWLLVLYLYDSSPTCLAAMDRFTSCSLSCSTARCARAGFRPTGVKWCSSSSCGSCWKRSSASRRVCVCVRARVRVQCPLRACSHAPATRARTFCRVKASFGGVCCLSPGLVCTCAVRRTQRRRRFVQAGLWPKSLLMSNGSRLRVRHSCCW